VQDQRVVHRLELDKVLYEEEKDPEDELLTDEQLKKKKKEKEKESNNKYRRFAKDSSILEEALSYLDGRSEEFNTLCKENLKLISNDETIKGKLQNEVKIAAILYLTQMDSRLKVKPRVLTKN
jgi:hypothetical protein